MLVIVFVCLSSIESINSQPIELGVVPIDSEFSWLCKEEKKFEPVAAKRTHYSKIPVFRT